MATFLSNSSIEKVFIACNILGRLFKRIHQCMESSCTPLALWHINDALIHACHAETCALRSLPQSDKYSSNLMISSRSVCHSNTYTFQYWLQDLGKALYSEKVDQTMRLSTALSVILIQMQKHRPLRSTALIGGRHEDNVLLASVGMTSP
jgi:hypothetical protein